MKSAGALMIIGSLCLTGLFFLPLWNIELGAPQYPDPLGLNIYINGIQGQAEFDVQNIDGLNHYIGMKTLPKADEMWEFNVFPKVVGVMVALGVLIGLLMFMGKLKNYWSFVWLIVMSVLGVMAMYDFNLWLTDYGTNLDPHAILKMQNPDGTPMTYKPPLLGHTRMLNFDAYSYPRGGAYMTFVGMLLILTSFFVGLKSKKVAKVGSVGMLLLLPFLMLSCTAKEEPIAYGTDACSYCSMTIVDKIHGAEYVTAKGKVHKFDAVECLVNDITESQPTEIALLKVNFYESPADFIDAEKAVYLISLELPSPMGANLTAFATREAAEKAQEEFGGMLYSWADLPNEIK